MERRYLRLDSTIIVGFLSLIGTICGSLMGVMASNKLTNFRIQELEKKMEKYNNLIERTYVVERDLKTLYNVVDDMKGKNDRFAEVIESIKNALNEIKLEIVEIKTRLTSMEERARELDEKNA